ncbi:hypothetical protein NS220_07565 [Microbacterium testaceum]|uniref:HTH cro/C1-type domain-containing protein n=1 Tax=Microbacterium testaceum TaxID=2033 RepID=A0A147EYJ9_MICTE|nr:helix-turn-helix transcriptional regulator [Microbacterium testaceum]KTR94867.1 hypothetical protein NS220_07565 [Microbacterium testaceum]
MEPAVPATEPPDTIARFAADLAALRSSSGAPSLAEMSRTTGISKSVLSDAFAGRRLPTEHTLRALVPALGGDVAPWLARRVALDPRYRAQPETASVPARTPHEAASPIAPRKHARPVTRATLIIAMSVCALLSSTLTVGGVWLLAGPLGLREAGSTGALPVPSSTYVAVETGADPMQSSCKNDAVLAGGDRFLDGQVLIEMMYSNSCMAVWGRVTRYDGLASGNTLSIKIYPKDDPQSERTQIRTESDVQSMYTKMLVEPDVDARVCGVATVTVDGQSFEQPNPVCI